MPIITKAIAGRRDPSRVNLFIDGKFAFSLSAEEFISRHLAKGVKLSKEQIMELSKLGSNEKIFRKILNDISYRPRSEKEVVDRLKRYAVESAQMTDILTKLKSLGYLDDLAFAQWFVDLRSSQNTRSSKHIANELITKGISPAIIKDVLSDKSRDRATLLTLISRKRTLSKSKLLTYLFRKGFSYDQIKEVFSSLGESNLV